MGWETAKWTNGKETISGWIYHWADDRFTICLHEPHRITGRIVEFNVYGDSPEWGDWKLVEEEK